MKILYITTIGSTMIFFRGFIESLINEGHTVDIACGCTDLVPQYYKDWGCKIYPLTCSRSPLDVKNIKSIGEIRKVVKQGYYDIVHCHTPVVSMYTRVACKTARKHGTKVIYTAHGFHFYKGAPLKNWVLYCPAERFFSRMTDILITINKEDYAYATKHMHAKQIEYVPGVGIDLDKFSDTCTAEEVQEMRKGFGLSKNDKMLLSVAELTENKNIASIIQALALLKDTRIHYFIAGVGKLKESLQFKAKSLGLEDRVHFLGWRNDVQKLYKCADLFVLASLREGLPVSIMEAIACGTPVICSRIRGNTDIVSIDHTFDPRNIEEIADMIKKGLTKGFMDSALLYGNLQNFDTFNVNSKLIKIYEIEV